MRDKLESLFMYIKIKFKENKKIFISGIVVIFLILGYMVGNVSSSKEGVLKKFEVGLKEGNANKVSDVVRINGKKVSKKELKPLIDYYKGKDNEINNIVKSLNKDGKSEIFSLVTENRIFKDKYYISLQTFSLKVTSNYDDAKLFLNDKEISQGEIIKNLIPGNYKISGTLQNKYGEMKGEQNILLMSDSEVKLNLDGVLVTAQSEFKDAKVLINGEDSGLLVKDFKDIGPIPSDGSVELSLIKDFPWGTIQGDEVPVTDVPDISLKINFENDELWSEIKKTMDTFYNSVFNALNNEDKNEIQGTTSSAKNKIYSTLEENYFVFKNKYDLISINIDKEKSNFQYNNGEFKGTVVCDVKYDVSKVLFGIGREEKNKSFLTKVVYKNNEWVVDDIENFSL